MCILECINYIFGITRTTHAIDKGIGRIVEDCRSFKPPNKNIIPTVIVSIGSNTTILNDEMFKYLRLHMLTAGDAVSHIGVSSYAQRFRSILRRRMIEDKLYFFSTALFGYHILLDNPDLSSQIILCEQGMDSPNIDLFKNWQLPSLSSTLNIHMLPLPILLITSIYLE